LSLTKGAFDRIVKPLLGLEISRPWQGYGSALGIELGRLLTTFEKTGSLQGEASVMLEWTWRFESEREVVFGAFDSNPVIETGLAGLAGSRVVDVRLEGRVPELVLELSSGLWLRTFAPLGGNPRWTIFLPDGSWLLVDKGVVQRQSDESSPAGPHLEEDEVETLRSEIAAAAAQRWGRKEIPEARGRCKNCIFYIRLNGAGHYLNYGACGSPGSIFDGRIVSRRSGCAAFAPFPPDPPRE
jgi:hypothetical protein